MTNTPKRHAIDLPDLPDDPAHPEGSMCAVYVVVILGAVLVGLLALLVLS